jgi:hypothetical protein
LEENQDKIQWQILSKNRNAINLIKKNLDKANWFVLSQNENALSILLENRNKIDWRSLSKNPNPMAIELLKQNQDKIYWYNLAENPAIFTYDYNLIKSNFKDLGEEIIMKALHPKRILKLMELYGEEEVYQCYFDEE